MYVLGIDPGLYGALAFNDPVARKIHVHDIPLLNIGKGKSTKMIVDRVALANLIDNSADEVSEVWLELVGSRPGEGHVGAFNFGKTYGLLLGVCTAHFLPVHDVTPQSWKASLRVSGDKDHSRLRASQILPWAAHQWPLKKHDGRAEAALISEYGVRKKALDGR